jgi:5-methylcytosine-specific restriction endonuclease McrA
MLNRDVEFPHKQKKKQTYTAKQRAMRNERLKALRAMPGAMALRNARERARNSRPEVRAIINQRQRERRANPQYRAMENARQNVRNSTPEARKNMIDRSKEYRKTPKGKAASILSMHIRRARIAGATIGSTKTILAWTRKWRSVKLVACYWCGRRTAGKTAHMDHIEPLAKGGAHSIENLCISCPPCNNLKRAKSVSAWNNLILEPVLL